MYKFVSMMEKIPNVQSERQNYITPETRRSSERNKQFYRDKVDAKVIKSIPKRKRKRKKKDSKVSTLPKAKR